MSQVVLALARQTATGTVKLLGTGFAFSEGYIATPFHVVGSNPIGLSVIAPRMKSLDDYQDTGDDRVETWPVKLVAADPVRDICLLRVTIGQFSSTLQLDSTDTSPVGSGVHLFGFPHASHGRMVLTRQHASIGARVLIRSDAIRSKHVILNVQTRDGQSGSPVILDGTNRVVAMIIGSYAPMSQGTVMINDIDPSTLHQTTHAISCEYIRKMIPDAALSTTSR